MQEAGLITRRLQPILDSSIQHQSSSCAQSQDPFKLAANCQKQPRFQKIRPYAHFILHTQQSSCAQTQDPFMVSGNRSVHHNYFICLFPGRKCVSLVVTRTTMGYRTFVNFSYNKYRLRRFARTCRPDHSIVDWETRSIDFYKNRRTTQFWS